VQLTRLQLKNFRGFEHLDLPVHERLSVIIGVNGAGKSSLLDAISNLLTRAFRLLLAGTPLAPDGNPARATYLSPSDLREGASEATLSIEARSANQAWRASWEQQGPLGQSTIGLPPGDLADNLVAYYSVHRALLQEEPEEALPGGDVLDRWEAFRDSLAWRGSLRSFVTWFRAREDVENERRLRENSEFRDAQLQAVRRALTGVMEGYEDLFVQRRPREVLMLSKHGKRLALNQLSDGEKCLLAMVGDLARRMAMVAREGQDPLDVEAVVMIDEIELHLHPRWQREVVPALLRTFPRSQFVLTTHSPQVLGSVARDSIFVLDDFRLYPASSPTKGRDGNSILIDLMGLSEHPPETAARLRVIAELLDEEHLAQARLAIDELAHDLGDSDREVVRLRSLLGFLEG
jgi:predicted ATP-binding protein involved in virulence